MSAWIVSKNHISTMVYFAIENNMLGEHTPDEFGQMLWQENHLSIKARYGANERDAPEYTYIEPVRKPTPEGHSSNVDCYDYQTCEHDSYVYSEAYKFIKAAKEILPKDQSVDYSLPEEEREVVWGWVYA